MTQRSMGVVKTLALSLLMTVVTITAPAYAYDTETDISFTFNDEDYNSFDNIALNNVQWGSQYVPMALATLPLTEGQIYNLEIDETDTCMSIFVDSVPILTAYNSPSTPVVDPVNVADATPPLLGSPVPESGATVLYVGAMILAMTWARKKPRDKRGFVSRS